MTPLYAKIELTVMVIFTVMRLYAHWYLIKMGLNLQKILYELGHISNKNGGIFIVIVYIWFISGQLNWLIFRPILILLFNTTSYECSPPIQLVNGIWTFDSILSWPLASQIIFTGLVWQMSSLSNVIENDEMLDDALSEDRISTSVDQERLNFSGRH